MNPLSQSAIEDAIDAARRFDSRLDAFPAPELGRHLATLFRRLSVMGPELPRPSAKELSLRQLGRMIERKALKT